MITYSPTSRYTGPSPLKHGLMALAVLIAIPAAVLGGVSVLGNPLDAESSGGVNLPAIVPPKPSYDLNGNSSDLPDLLAEPEPTAPVITVDILGNAPTSPSLAGNLPVMPAIIPGNGSQPSNTNSAYRPQTPTIDGQPIDSIGSKPPPGRFLPKPAPASGPLPIAPLPGLSRMTPFGPVPAASRDGRTARSVYAKPFSTAKTSKTVSIIVGGLGINAVQTTRAIDELPPEVTLSFASQSTNLQRWINKARQKGHEVILELPMEPYNFDPNITGGRYTLLANAPASTNIRNLDYLLSRAQGYFAVTNYLGEQFLDKQSAIAPVAQHLSGAGLGFVFDGVAQNTALENSAKNAKLPWVQNRAVIDISADALAVEQSLSALEQSIRPDDPVLGMGFSYPGTIDAIKTWSEGLSERGVTLAPASYALRAR